MLFKFFSTNILRTDCGQILLYFSQQTSQKKNPLAGLNLSNALVELGGFVLIQWPENDKKFS